MARAALVALAALMLLAACGEEENYYGYAGQNQVTVTGNGTASAEPDMAVVIFAVDITGDDPAEVTDEAAQKVDAAIAAAMEMGLPEDDIYTSSYSLWTEKEYDPVTYNETGEIIYHLSHYLRADIRDPDSVGEFLAIMMESGVNTVSSVSFTLEDRFELAAEARADAVEKAQQKAGQLAEGLGVELGEITMVNEYTNYYPMTDYSTMGYGGYAGEMSAPDVSPGSFTMGVDVTITYKIRE
ncbi:MAG: SIMPL domain-containing protein [Candidatus Fermentibacteraceae bacterium]